MPQSSAKLASLLAILLVIALHGNAMTAEERISIDADLADAGKMEDPNARLGKIDEILAKYGNTEDEYVQSRVVKGKLDKARLSGDRAEKQQLYDESIVTLEKVFDADPRNANNLGAALLNRAELESNPAKRAKFLNRVVESLTAPEQAAMMANAMRQLAAAGATPEEQLQRYTELVDCFSKTAMPDTRLGREVAESMVEKAGLLSDSAERLAALDAVITRYGEAKDGYVRVLVANAKVSKAALVTDEEEKRRLYDECIADFENLSLDDIRNRDSLIAAFLNRAALEYSADGRTKYINQAAASQNTVLAVHALGLLADESLDKEEKDHYYNQITQRLSNTKTPGNQADIVTIAILEARAGMLADPAERTAALTEIVTRYGAAEDERVQSRVIKVKLDIARSTKDKAEKRRIFDECIPALEKLRTLDIRNQYNLGTALVNRAELEEDPTQRARLLTQALENLPLPNCARQAARALRMLANDTPDTEEKIRRYDAVIARFSALATPDNFVGWEVAKTLNAKARVISEPTEKLAVLDRVIDTFGNSKVFYTLGQVVWAMLQKVELLDDDNEKIAIYERIVDNYENSGDTYLSSSVERAFQNRLKLAGYGVDKTSIYDKRLAGLPDSAPAQKIARLRYERVGAVKDKAEQLKRYDEVVVLYRDAEVPEVQFYAVMALMGKAEQQDYRKDRMAAYDDIVTSFGDNQDTKIRDLILSVLNTQALNSKNDEDKIHFYNAIIERFKNDTDDRILSDVSRTLALKAKIDGDTSHLLAYQDRILATAKDHHVLAQALITKAEIVADKAEKEKYYDQLLERFSENENGKALKYLARAHMGKAQLTDDKVQQNAAYDAIIELERRWHSSAIKDLVEDALEMKAKNTGNNSEQLEYYDNIIATGKSDILIGRAMLSKAEHLESKADKLALYDAMLAQLGDNDNIIVKGILAKARISKVELVEDITEKHRLYDNMLIEAPTLYADNFAVLHILHEAFTKRIDLVADQQEKIELLDRLIAFESKYNLPSPLFKTMKKKAELLTDVHEKKLVYNAMFEKYLEMDKSWFPNPERPDPVRVAKRGLSEDEDERFFLYDEFVEMVEPSDTKDRYLLDNILKQRTELIGDTTTITTVQ